MNKKILSAMLVIIMILISLPTMAMEKEQIALNEVFENYATNSTAAGSVKVVSGVDGRIVKESNGNKAVYTKAWGENGKITATYVSPDANETVYSAKIKLSGSNTSGKLFSISGLGAALDLLTLTENGAVIIPGGRQIGGVPKDRWATYTFMINWEKSMMDVYVDGRCVESKFYLPSAAYLSMNTMIFSLSEPESGYSELMVDDIRVYEGNLLPGKVKFPSVSYNNEEEPFEKTITLDMKPAIYYDNSFTDGNGAISIIAGVGSILHKKDGENGYINLFGDEITTTTAYFDIAASALGSEQKYVFSFDFKVNKLTGGSLVRMFDGRDDAGAWRMGVNITSSGIVDGTSQKQLFGYTQGEWHNIALCYNTGESKYDIYFNGELYAGGIATKEVLPTTIRVDVRNAAGGVLNIDIDNLRFYKGKKPMTEEEYREITSGGIAEGEVSVVDYTSEAVSYIGKNTVFMLTNNKMFADGKKIDYPSNYTPQVIDGVFAVTPDVLGAAGVSVVYDSKSGNIDVLNGKVKLTVGSDILETDGKKIKMPKAVSETDGTVYIPVRSLFVDGLGKKLYYDERGFVIIHDGTFNYTNSTVPNDAFKPTDSVFKYMQYDNPKAAQILADIEKTVGNAHPRLHLTSDDVNYILDRVEGGNTQWKKFYSSAISVGDGLIDKVITSSPPDNQKQSVGSVYESRMEALALAYMLTGDDKYAKCGVDNMIAVCSWDTLGETVSQLVAGSWMFGTALGIDAFYSYLMQHKEEFDFIKENVKRLAFDPITKAYKGENANIRWIKMTDNFNGFVGGGGVMLCLALADEVELKGQCGYLLENLLKTLGTYVSIFEPDGAWYEGVSYGKYGLTHPADAFMALKNCCGSDYAMVSGKGMKSAADWYIYASTPQSGFNFHDMQADTVTTAWCGYYIAYLNNDAARMEATMRFMALTNTTPSLRQMLCYEKVITNRGINVNLDNLPLDHYFDSADAGTFYSNLASDKPTFVGFHGGWTGLPHDMLDLGCFMFISDGVVWAYDTGRDNYSLPGYFALSGYRHYRKCTQGENVLTINPSVDRQNYYGQDTKAEAVLVKYETKERGAMAAYDLTEPYKRDVSAYKRGYYFGDDRNTLTVRDELTLKGKSEIYWAMHTRAEIEIIDNKTAILSLDGKTLKAEVVTNARNYELKVMDAALLPGSPGLDASDKMDSVEGIRKLVLYIPEKDKELDITVKLSPQNGKYIGTPIDGTTKIDNWMLPDGTLPKPLVLSEIKVDGVEIENFYAEKTEYTVSLPFGREDVPIISATSQTGTVTVTNATNIGEKTVIKLEKEGYAPIEYKIAFVVSSDREISIEDALFNIKPTEGAQGSLIMPRIASASHVQDDAHDARALMDNDTSTYCAADGNCWFEIDLGEVTDISGVAISFYVGSTRTQKYDLLYSEDGINYKRVFSGDSLGTTEDYESVAAPGRARYIRFAGYGNSSSSWNSVLEMRAYK